MVGAVTSPQETRFIPGGLTAARPWAVAAVLGLLALVMPFAANGTVIALLLLALLTLSWHGLRSGLGRAPPLLLTGLAALAAWTIVSAVWSPLDDPGKAARTVLLFVPGIIVVTWMAGDQRRSTPSIDLGLGIAIVGALLLFLFEAISGAALTRLIRGADASPATIAISLEIASRGVVLFAILIWPTALALSRRRALAGAGFFVGAAAAVALLPMNAALVGLLLGSVAFVAALLLPRTTFVALGLAVALYAALAPTLSREVVTLAQLESRNVTLPAAWAHRVGIWSFAAEQAAAHAPWGAGFDAARAIGREGHVLEELRPQLGYAPAAMPLHPHNAFLQVWLELGVVGVIALALLFVGLLQAAWRLSRERWSRAAAAAAIVTALPPFVLNFGVWQAWWISALWLGAALTVGFIVMPARRLP